MTIPDFQSLLLPLLKFAGDGETHKSRDAINYLASFFSLTDQDLSEMIASGQFRFENRVGWARPHLKKAGLIDYPQRGHFQITSRGKEVLEKKPKKIDMALLSQFPEYNKFRETTNYGGTIKIPIKPEELTPEESIELEYQKIRNDLTDKILDYVIRSSPPFFEKLVVQLLVAMGYGGSHKEASRAVGRSGDEGIDGIIDEDRLGLDVIYIQAKRWKRDSKVSRPQIQAFVGALVGRHAKKGVFITTAEFTNEAYDFSKKLDTKVVLIDGLKLASLMIDHGIGVSTKSIIEIKELDTDYFIDISE